MKKSYLLLMTLLMGSLYAISQEKEASPDHQIRSRTYDKNGNEIVGIIVPGIPPQNHHEPIANPTRSTVSLSSVPAFSWSFGCSATAAAMAAGYYDNIGYPDMYTGPTNAGIMPMNNSSWGTVVINSETLAQCPLSATRNGVDGRAVRGYVDDYWVQTNSSTTDPYITNGWTQHTYGDCTGDFMGTSQSVLGNIDGGTMFYMYTNGSPLYNYSGCEPAQIDGCHGMRDFYESRGYTVVQNYSQYIYGYSGNTLGFTFNQFKNEIDNGRPVLIQVTNHTMIGYGYDDAGTLIYLHDTWDYSNHSMTWGGTYAGLQHYGVTVVQLGPGTYIPTANFSASLTVMQPATPVTFTDLSIMNPTSWSWVFSPFTVTYLGGTTSSSQNPQVSFDNSGFYTVSLTVTNVHGSDSETKNNYIHAYVPGMWAGNNSSDWNTAANWDDGVVPAGTTNVSISSSAANWPSFTGDFSVGSQCGNLTIPAGALFNITGNFTINAGKTLAFTGAGELNITGDWTKNGTFTPGTGTVKFSGTNPSSVNYSGTVSNITTYTRSTFTKGMVHLTDSITGPSGDDGSVDANIGLTFNYLGINYTSVHICTNGWIAFNATGNASQNPNLFTATVPNITLAPWWDDLKDDATSFVSYKTDGSAPSRIFTVEWHRILTYSSTATSRITFQVKLFESTNVIEFHYGNYNGGTTSSGETASIGIEDATGGTNHYIEATTGSNSTPVTNLKASLNWPTVNYRFTPPTAIETFNNLEINKTGTQVSFNCDVNVADTITVSPGATLKISPPRTIRVNGI
jgi:PKD repeat protein